MDLFKVEDKVRLILKNNEAARADDMTLYSAYAWDCLEKAGAKVGSGWLEKVFADVRFRTIYGIAPFESVSRARRKIQENHIELRPREEVVRERQERIREYKAYARRNFKDM